MNYIEKSLRSYLAGITAVSNIVQDRIHPNKLPDNEQLPAIVITKISSPRFGIHDGQSGLTNPRIQIDLWAENYASVKALADVVRLNLDGKAQSTLSGVLVQAIRIIDESDSYDSDVQDYRVTQDYEVWHEENKT